MLKKSLLSLSIAAGMGLAGCSGTDSTGTTGPNGGVIPVGGDGNTKVIYSPEQGLLPLQSDLLFVDAASTDGTANTDDTTPPVTTAINDLDGWSTVSQIDIAFDGSIDSESLDTDPASSTQNVFLIKLATDSAVQSLDITQIAAKAERQTLIFKAYAATAAYLQALAGGADAATAIATAQATAASSSVQIPPFAVSDSDFLVDLKTTILTNLAAINTGGPLNGSYTTFKAVFDSITTDGTLNGETILSSGVGFAFAQYNVDNNGMTDDGAGLYDFLVDEFNLEADDSVAITGTAATLYDGDYRAEVITQDGTSNNTLRITPVKPLDPKTKYVVAVVGGENGVKDSSGEAVLASSSYSGFKKNPATDPYDLPELRGLQTLVNNLEDITAGFASATKNLSDEATAQLESDIILSYTFTTGGVDDVLLGMTIPNVALDNAIPGVVAGVFASSFDDTIEAQYRTDNGIDADAELTVNQQSAVESLQSAFATQVKLYPEIAVSPAPVSLNAYIATLDLSALETAQVQALLPKPQASSEVGFWNTIEATSGTITFPDNMTVAPGKVYEGWIELPYYGYAPDGTESSDAGVEGIKGSQWVADQTLGGALETALTGAASGALPPADADGEYNVTYNFPFAAKQTDETVPVVVSYPGMSSVVDAGSGATLEQAILASAYTAISGDTNLPAALTSYLTAEAADPSQLDVKNALIAGDATGLLGAAVDGPYPTVIYNHGITNDRSNSLPLGNQLGAACYSADATTGLFSITGVPCYVTVSIDQPLHGASVTYDETGVPTGSATEISGLTNVDFASAANALPNTVPAELRERHFGYTILDATTQAAGQSPNGAVASGSLFINLLNFQNSRDNLRQQILDLSTLNASLTAIDAELQTYDASTEGFLTYTSPLAALGGTDRVTTHFVGHSLGGVNGIPFVASNNKSFGGAALQAGAVATAGGNPARYLPNINPVLGANFAMTGGGIPKLLENSASTSFGAPVILTGLSNAGIERGTANYEKFLNVFQATLDSTDPVNYMDNFQQGALSTATPGSLFFEISGAWDVNGTYTTAPDQTIPNDADNRPLPPLDLSSLGFGVAESAPLSGTEPLLRESTSNAALPSDLPLAGLGAEGNEGVYDTVAGFQAAGAALAADAGATSQSISVASRFNAGSHGTIVSVDNASVFGEMVGQIATFFATSGRAVLVNDSTLLSDCDPSADAANPQCL
ncbi:hypothetical protein ACFOEK_06405 [Litoribrevibacter euphylliae]|uniref:Bacterial virulence factor lipase N-terminal domain-containing protein n=1 Tax=Litoribrevibacter euphylliae TaxID=1834034 RepID=A0ABV7H9S5_9GAMM